MRQRVGVVALAAVLVGWSSVTVRIPARWHPVPHVVFGTAVWALSRAPLGLRPPAVWAGLRWGLAAAAPVVVSVAAATAIPPVRAGMSARTLPTPISHWLLVRIPVGTVWSEEAAYRGALNPAAGRVFGRTCGQLVTAAAFGLSHVPDARATGQPVLGTVLATGAAGWVFAWLHDKSGSLAAPMLAHLVINEAGAVAALAVQRRQRSSPRRLRAPGGAEAAADRP